MDSRRAFFHASHFVVFELLFFELEDEEEELLELVFAQIGGLLKSVWEGATVMCMDA